MDWKNNLKRPEGERLFKVGPYYLALGDIVSLGFQPEELEEAKDPWARKSNYNVQEVKSILHYYRLKAEINAKRL